MGKRGPQPRGEYANKTAVFSCRLQPDSRRALVAAAAKSGRSISQELEHRLRQTFDDDKKDVLLVGNAQNAAVVRLIAMVIQAAGTDWMRKTDAGWVPDESRDSDWLHDAKLFDQVVTAIGHVLDLFYPGKEADRRFVHYNSTADELLDDIVAANPALPLKDKESKRQRSLARIRDGLGGLLARPHPLATPMKRMPPIVREEAPQARKKQRHK